MKNKVKKKPTAKEMASAIIEINSKVNNIYKVVQQLDNIIGLYIEMKKDIEEFNIYVEKRSKEQQEKAENDSRKNEEANKSNLQGDTDGESRGTEGVREKKE
tara:strand:- start:705 stop:1010 length:306 start_codon:yes stop_codon:yes gene_type:complete